MGCMVCGVELPPRKGTGRRMQTCSNRCHTWKRAHPGVPPRWLSERRCLHCGEVITSDDVRLKYCTITCRRRFKTQSVVGKAGPLPTCRYCGEGFAPNNGMQVYCGKRCRIRWHQRFSQATTLRSEARKRGVIPEGRFSLLDVAERDGWVCALCFWFVDPEERSGRMRATVDHVVPLSKGGRHTWENVQLTHGCCNAAKRDSDDVVSMSLPFSPGKREMLRGRDPETLDLAAEIRARLALFSPMVSPEDRQAWLSGA